MNTIIIAKFGMSYADLVQLADKAADLVLRDAQELQSFGVAPADRIFITTEADRLRLFPTDQELLGTQTFATANKESIKALLQKTISEIMLRVKIISGMSSPAYNRYDTSDLHKGSDAEMVRLAYRVHRVATEDFAVLSRRGLTQQDLDTFLINIKAFDDAIDAKEKASRNRDRSQQERVLIANGLYDKIVEVFECGKAVFNTDPARYNDYIIYDNTSSTPSASAKAAAKTAADAAQPTVVVEPVNNYFSGDDEDLPF